MKRQMENAIELQDVQVTRGTFILKDINLQVGEKEIFAILGKTGSGKTVLLETITGFGGCDRGEVRVNGQPVESIPIQKRRIGFVYQDYQLFPHMTVEQNIEYGMKMNRYPKEQMQNQTEQLLEMFGITHIRRQYPATLSGGERQRTAFARALALQPEILLLDEPFSALDPVTKEGLYQELKEIHRKFGCTIVFVTHNYHEAEFLADRIGIMENGELVKVVKSDKLMTTSFGKEIDRFLGREEE